MLHLHKAGAFYRLKILPHLCVCKLPLEYKTFSQKNHQRYMGVYKKEWLRMLLHKNTPGREGHQKPLVSAI